MVFYAFNIIVKIFMGRKKNLQNLDEFERGYIEAKMEGNSYVAIQETNMPLAKALDFKVNLKCKNKKQKELHNLIKDKEVVICSGIFGCGKSYVINETALELVKNLDNAYQKIIIVIPTLESSGKELSIGLLPGTKDEKMSVYLDADLDTFKKILKNSGNLGSEMIVNSLVNAKIIDWECVNFSLGKTWDNSIILINEAENFNKQEILLLLSRLGENSKIIISGDINQCTRASIIKNNEECGMLYAMKKLKDLDEIGIIEFSDEDIVRNKLIYEIYTKWKEK